MSGIRLDGKAAIVTGASKGIGRAIALTLAGAGASVLGTARHDDGVAELAQAAKAAGGAFHFRKADASRWDDCQAVAAEALERFGRIDILVNNAGTSMPHIPIDSITEADWLAVTGVTFNGVAFMSRAALPAMIAQADGSIVNIASTAGVQTGAAMG